MCQTMLQMMCQEEEKEEQEDEGDEEDEEEEVPPPPMKTARKAAPKGKAKAAPKGKPKAAPKGKPKAAPKGKAKAKAKAAPKGKAKAGAFASKVAAKKRPSSTQDGEDGGGELVATCYIMQHAHLPDPTDATHQQINSCSNRITAHATDSTYVGFLRQTLHR